MRGNRKLPSTALLALGLIFALSAKCRAADQPGTYSLDANRQPILAMDGQWRFHTGDDPAWSAASFDDSSWKLIGAKGGWSDQGFKDYGGTAWYRARVSVPANSGPLSIYICCVRDNYQVFADGVIIGTAGDTPPNPRPYETHMLSRVYSIPPPSTPGPRQVTMAIRVWQWPHWSTAFSGGLHAGILLGDSSLIDHYAHARIIEDAWSVVSGILLTILEALAGATALVLFSMRRRQPEYLWFGISMLTYAAARSFYAYEKFHLMPYQVFNLGWYLTDASTSLTNIALYFYLLKARRGWALNLVVASVVTQLLLGAAENAQLISLTLFTEIATFLRLPVTVWILTLLIRRAMQGFGDARLLLIPLLISRCTLLIDIVLAAIYYAGWYRGDADWYYSTSQWPFPFSLGDLADGLFLVGMIAILIYRFTRTSKQQERLSSELEAARTVQQVLVPEATPAIPGYTIATVYRPAGQVGGDFFQVLPASTGGVLLVLGDVSGKGLPAAMTVALLVGSLRTLAETTESPALLLAGLNRRLYGRGTGAGFTTCLILRADATGQVTLANAGHLAPYLTGTELPQQSGLPLGLIPQADYAESTFQLKSADQLTLVTDGVVEARNLKTGELFGFDRTLAISLQSAESIVQTAQAFGQDDDITALTLQRA